jgi:hypothetical protein
MAKCTRSWPDGDWRKSSFSFHEANCLEAAWRKSSHSEAGNCLEAAWHRSSHSIGNANCTEAAIAGGHVLVRDSKDPDGPVLKFSPGQWTTFTEGIKG